MTLASFAQPRHSLCLSQAWLARHSIVIRLSRAPHESGGQVDQQPLRSTQESLRHSMAATSFYAIQI